MSTGQNNQFQAQEQQTGSNILDTPVPPQQAPRHITDARPMTFNRQPTNDVDEWLRYNDEGYRPQTERSFMDKNGWWIITLLALALFACVIFTIILPPVMNYIQDEGIGNLGGQPTSQPTAVPTTMVIQQATTQPTQVVIQPVQQQEVVVGNWPAGDPRNWRPSYEYEWNGIFFTTVNNAEGFYTLLDNGTRDVTGYPQDAFNQFVSGLYRGMVPSSYYIQPGHTVVVRYEDNSFTDVNQNNCGQQPPVNSTQYDVWYNCADGVSSWFIVVGGNNGYTLQGDANMATLEYSTYPENVLTTILNNGSAYDINEYDATRSNWHWTP